MSYSIQRLSGEADVAQVWEEWQALHESVAPRTPFGSPLWNMLWWKHFSRRSLAASCEFFVHLVRDASGALRGVAPWMILHRLPLTPLRVSVVTPFGADASLTEIRGVICRRDDEGEIVAALDRHLRETGIAFAAVEWMGVRGYDALDILEAQAPLSFAQVNQFYVLALPKTWEGVRAHVGSYMRRNLRRVFERIDALGKTLRLDVYEDADAIGARMDNFFRLHSMRAGARDMFAHPDKFAKPVNRRFVEEAYLAFARRGEARYFEACIEDKVVACRLCFALGGTLYVYYSGYDPEWQDYNVGTLMMANIIQWAIGQGFEDINLSAGKDRSKLQWKPVEHHFQGGVRIRSNFRGRLASNMYSAMKRVRAKPRSASQ